MKPISEIVNDALNEITSGSLACLSDLAITGLLDDFIYVWLKRLDIKDFDFEMIDLARLFCGAENRRVFKAVKCKSIDEIRAKLQKYLLDNCRDDNRVIVSLKYEEGRIISEWVPMKEYLEPDNKKRTG